MLWYKAWLETRSRFVIALVGCVAFCLMWVVEFGKGIVASRGQAGLFDLFHAAHAGLCFLLGSGSDLPDDGRPAAREGCRCVRIHPRTAGEPPASHVSALWYGLTTSDCTGGRPMDRNARSMAGWRVTNTPFGKCASMYFCCWVEA